MFSVPQSVRKLAREGLECILRDSITVDSPASLKEVAEFLGAGVPSSTAYIGKTRRHHGRKAPSHSAGYVERWLDIHPKGKKQTRVQLS